MRDTLKIRSSLPGRVRFEVPPLLRRPALAAAVMHDLEARSGISSVVASPVTGSLLLKYDEKFSLADAMSWVEHAFARLLGAAFETEPAPAAAATSTAIV